MLENPTETSSNANTTSVKRYAPPNQRNRSLGRRKSGVERFDRINNFHANEGEKSQAGVSRNIPTMDHGDASGSNLVYETPYPRLISLSGCCNSEAYQLLNDRWVAAISSYNDTSVDLADRPVMYSSNTGPPMAQFRLPHQLINPGASSGSQMDFLSELRRAMSNANASSNSF
ncbi:uncharacterized protein LOC124917252 [Impatiens glandulifera]|uniref:uncharacterized protein LOC124917252 n=1 Tax=Impatiens glandulifera TaxID=253017 RepID=UPI001FB141AE|nr:uncharacterized protein LOC124917252 [Impatiens glandulifera]